MNEQLDTINHTLIDAHMSRDSRSLRELTSMELNVQRRSSSSMERRSSKRRKKECLTGLDSENTPQEHLLHRSTTSSPEENLLHGSTSSPEENLLHGSTSPAHPALLTSSSSSGKENQASTHFVLARRTRRRKESTSDVSMDSLPDEILLRIFLCLPLPDLLRSSSVSKRWHDLTFDESLWRSVDLGGGTHMAGALQRVLTAGVRKLRCPSSFITDFQLTHTQVLRVRQMDLSNCTISTSCLENIVIGCSQLTHLSLESLLLSDRLIQGLSQNTHMSHLNLCGCDGFSAASGGHMLRCFPRLEELNISWNRNFSQEHVKQVVSSVTSDLTHLNLSGYRETLRLEDVKILVKRCPNIITLDLSDSAQLNTDCFPVIGQLKNLMHLSLSRCYQIHPATLVDLAEISGWFPALRLLEVFGLIQSEPPKKNAHHQRIAVNSRPYSAVARPGATGESEAGVWDAACRLTLM